MKNVKRFAEGGNVQVDVSGTGEWVFGVIASIDGKTVTIQPSDGTDVVTTQKSEVMKATAAEVKAYSNPEDESDNQEDEGEGSRSIVPQKYRESYTEARLKSGRKTLHNNDTEAISLIGLDLEEVKKFVAKVMGTSAAQFTKKWGHLNRGQQRMLIGNAFRKFNRDTAEA